MTAIGNDTIDTRPAQEDRLRMVDMAGFVGATTAFGVAALAAPITGTRTRLVVFGALLLATAVTGLVGGRIAAAQAAVMSAFSYDFFHTEPQRLLKAGSLARYLLIFVTVALVSAVRPARRDDERSVIH